MSGRRLAIGDRRFEVSVSAPAGDGSFEITVARRSLRVEPLAATAEGFLVRFDGRRVEVTVARTDEETWVCVGGRTRRVRDAAESDRRGRGAGGVPAGAITPPMPGVVAAVLVQVGDVVARNAPLVVVSAMKMETTLVARCAGTVRAVHVRPGTTVGPGDVLVEIEAEPPGGADGSVGPGGAGGAT